MAGRGDEALLRADVPGHPRPAFLEERRGSPAQGGARPGM